MAQYCYGYGRWDAPYWFIGPEQGQRRVENGDLGPRLSAWVKLGSRELCDCEEFHQKINEHAWHREGKLQSTWKRLIRLLMAFLEQPTDTATLREYQRKRWGMADAETCVIELFGLAANNLSISRDRQPFRKERIATIRERIRVNRPKLVVMYGTGQREICFRLVSMKLICSLSLLRSCLPILGILSALLVKRSRNSGTRLSRPSRPINESHRTWIWFWRVLTRASSG